MCERFPRRYLWREIHGLVRPGQRLPQPPGPLQRCAHRRGRCRQTWKRLKYLPASFNARAESVADTPMFRGAFHWQRCIIPASGYYEWIARPNHKQPYYISAADGGTLSFAELWDRWRNLGTRESVMSCTIIVNALTRPIHDRMPVILEPADFKAWLCGNDETKLLRPAADDKLRVWPVSRRVNQTGSGDDDATLIDGVAA
jgi:putative SOS response-associated peptidase YedK